MTINYNEAVSILNEFGGYGSVRVYATYKDGVYIGQKTGVKSITMLDELTSAYNVTLESNATSLSDLITQA